RGGICGLLGKDVLEAAIEGLFHFGRSGEIAAQPIFGSRLRAVHGSLVKSIIIAATVRFGCVGRGLSTIHGWLRRTVRLCTLEQRVALKLLFDEGHKIEI